MTTKQDLARRLTAAAASRKDGATPTGRTALRTKPIRVTLDLNPADYETLNRWLARTGVELDQPVSRLTLARALRAMIHATTTDDVVNGVVVDLLRRDQA